MLIVPQQMQNHRPNPLLLLCLLFFSHLELNAQAPISVGLLDSIQSVSAAVWSTDSKALYYTTRGALVRVSLDNISIDTVGAERGFGGTPRISHDHRRIALQHGNGVWLLRPNDGKLIQESSGDIDSRWDIHPNGERVVFAGKGFIWSRVSARGRHARVKKSPQWFGRNDLMIDTLSVASEEGIIWIFSPYGSPFEWSLHGERLYFLSARSGWNKIWSVDSDGKQLRQETFGEGDDRDFQVLEDGSLIFVSNREKRVEWSLWYQKRGRQPEYLCGRDGTVQGPSLSPDGKHISFLYSTSTQPSELFVYDLSSRFTRKLTRNAPASLSRHVISAQVVRFPSGTYAVEGIMYVPPSVNASKPSPAIIRLHGGPSMHDGLSWNSTHQFFASRGYVVLAINYTGSVGYGKAFEEADRYRLGMEDCDDVAAGAKFLQSLPSVKHDRIGVSGSSYGGYLTNLVVGRYPRLFSAAVSWYGIVNWFTNDAFPRLHWAPKYFFRDRMGDPASHQRLYQTASPISYADSVRTPLLLAHGDADTVVPINQSEEFYAALKERKKTAEFSVYPGEGHGWSKNQTRVDAYRRMEHWFDRYLKD